MEEENRFQIDFTLFAILAEACIPPVPIARAMFWDDVCDKYYHVMSKFEREKLFEWVQLNGKFDKKNEDCLYFYNRFDSTNQYVITTDYKGKIEEHECFLHNKEYHTNKSTSIIKGYMIDKYNT